MEDKKKTISEEFKEKINAMSDEEYLALWENSEVAKFKNVGPTIEEYLGFLKTKNK